MEEEKEEEEEEGVPPPRAAWDRGLSTDNVFRHALTLPPSAI